MVVYCYVSIVIALQFFDWSVVLWIGDTLYTNKFLVLVFGWHIYLTLGSLCFSLYIGTTHYSILQFLVFIYLSSTCLHVLLALCAPGCNIVRLRWTQPCWALHVRLMSQFGHIISILSLPCSAASSFWCELYFVMTELYLVLEFVQHKQVHVYELPCATKTPKLSWIAFSSMFGLSLIFLSFIYNL